MGTSALRSFSCTRILFRNISVRSETGKSDYWNVRLRGYCLTVPRTTYVRVQKTLYDAGGENWLKNAEYLNKHESLCRKRDDGTRIYFHVVGFRHRIVPALTSPSPTRLERHQALEVAKAAVISEQAICWVSFKPIYTGGPKVRSGRNDSKKFHSDAQCWCSGPCLNFWNERLNLF